MKPKRALRVGEEILKELSLILIERISDPRLKDITFTHVKMTDDLRTAKVYFSILGGAEKVKEAQMGLAAAKGFIKKEIALRMTLRYVPDFIFFYDETFEYGHKIEKLLQKIDHERKQRDQ